jgi:MoxR-like ATPase
VQFTPDLLPADILGSSVYSPRDGTFTFKEGPVFANVLLADEINRASPRTQSALLEAMSEGQVSSEGVTRVLPSPFLVLATQNPVEFHGTYPLPEAQLDRFGLRIGIGYPAAEQEADVLFSQAERHPLESVTPVLSAADVVGLQAESRRTRVERSLGRYMVALAEATRRHPSVRLGCSPRGTLALFRAAQARALFEGRAFVVPEDVKTQAVPVLAHRLGLETKARYTGVSKEDIVREVLEGVPVPA